MKRIFLIVSLYLSVCLTSLAQQVIPLYEGNIPGEIPAKNEELVKNGIYFAVSKPDLSIYLPEDQSSGRTAVIICPGGGYGAVCASYEGHDIARKMNALGVAAFVLKYRLPDDKTCSDKTIAPLQDAQRAVKIVRENAEKWGIDPQRIGVMGFSAGGHLASTVGTHFMKSFIENKELTSLRPDFMMLVYPVISMQPGLTHAGSRDNLLGENATQTLLDLYSNEKQVTGLTPPAFLIHAADDDLVPVENSIRFYEALKANQIPAGLHLFSKGKHGFPLEPAKSAWRDYVFRWMKEQHLTQE